jgi:hypothetical protein
LLATSNWQNFKGLPRELALSPVPKPKR